MGERLVYKNASGVELDLSNTNLIATVGKLGWGSPPVEHRVVPNPSGVGDFYNSLRVLSRVVTVPVLIMGDSQATIEDKMAELERHVFPTGADGELHWYTENNPDGKLLYCQYQDGLKGDDSNMTFERKFAKAFIMFYAADPYWYDLTETETTYTLSAPAESSFLKDPFFPWLLTASTTFAGPTITNSGNVNAWPEWEITGPGDTIYLVNNTTGEELQFTNNGGLTLTDGETVIIKTRPGERGVTNAVTGENLFKYLSKGSTFWPLAAGDNDISIQINNPGGNTDVTVTYRSAYSGVRDRE